MINELDFDLVSSIFVKNNINYLSMKEFNDEDKIYFTEKCNNCNKYTNTKTKCGHNLCYQCILNIDECPICKQDTKLKILKRKNILFIIINNITISNSIYFNNFY